MVGLSIVLEAQKRGVNNKTPQVINKATMIMNRPSSSSSSCSSLSSPGRFSSPTSSQSAFPVPAFLEQCFLCGLKLLPGKDIYMYKGDRAFCSDDCRCRQIFMDEEESLRKEKCCMAAMASASSSSSPSSSRHRGKSNRNRAGGFAF